MATKRLTKGDYETLEHALERGGPVTGNSRQMKKLTRWGYMEHAGFDSVRMRCDDKTIEYYRISNKGRKVLQNDNS